jgi:hypothetical protein
MLGIGSMLVGRRGMHRVAHSFISTLQATRHDLMHFLRNSDDQSRLHSPLWRFFPVKWTTEAIEKGYNTKLTDAILIDDASERGIIESIGRKAEAGRLHRQLPGGLTYGLTPRRFRRRLNGTKSFEQILDARRKCFVGHFPTKRNAKRLSRSCPLLGSDFCVSNQIARSIRCVACSIASNFVMARPLTERRELRMTTQAQWPSNVAVTI